MALEQKHKERLGDILARLRPGFEGQVLAYKDYFIEWNDVRPLPNESEIIAEFNKILAEEDVKKSNADKAANLRKELKKLTQDVKQAKDLEELKLALGKVVEYIELRG